MQRIPVRGSRDTGRHPEMNGVDEDLEILDGRVGQDAMSQVEDVAVAAARAVQHVARPLANQVWRPQQHSRVEIALDAQPVTDEAPSLVERQAPVERHYVRPGIRYRLEQTRGISAEVDARHAERLECPEDCACMAHDARLIVFARKRAHPRVEQLDRLGASRNLSLEVSAGRSGRAGPLARPNPSRAPAALGRSPGLPRTSFWACGSRPGIGPPLVGGPIPFVYRKALRCAWV